MTTARTPTSHTVPLSPGRRSKKLLWTVAAAMVIAVATIVVALVALSGRASPAPKPANAPIGTVQSHRPHLSTYNENCLPSRVIHPC